MVTRGVFVSTHCLQNLPWAIWGESWVQLSTSLRTDTPQIVTLSPGCRDSAVEFHGHCPPGKPRRRTPGVTTAFWLGRPGVPPERQGSVQGWGKQWRPRTRSVSISKSYTVGARGESRVHGRAKGPTQRFRGDGARRRFQLREQRGGSAPTSRLIGRRPGPLRWSPGLRRGPVLPPPGGPGQLSLREVTQAARRAHGRQWRCWTLRVTLTHAVFAVFRCVTYRAWGPSRGRPRSHRRFVDGETKVHTLTRSRVASVARSVALCRRDGVA